jgi:glycosyltransferase involved in cell wall biosynthesis
VPEVVEDGVTGLLVPPGDDAAYAMALAGLLADPGRARAMGQAARDRVAARHAFPVAVARLDALIRGVTGG